MRRIAWKPACVVLDAMGVMFAAADDVEELLIPFVAAYGGVADAHRIRSAYLDASLGAIGADEFWTLVGLSPAIEDDYLSRHSLAPGVMQFLRSATDAGVPVWCLSNDVARWSAKLRASFGLDELLSGAVISSDVRSRKPDAAIYRRLLDRCGEAPADILFVDDRKKNVLAARALGMTSIEFDAENGYRALAAQIFGTGGGMRDPEKRPVSSKVTLQPFLPPHLPLLAKWLREPHVAPWYPEPEANLEWAASPPAGGSQAIIASGADEIGWLRWQRVDRDTLDSLGLRDIPANSVDADILIGERSSIGRGLGPAALAALIVTVREDETVPLIGLTSSVNNHSAHRAFEKAGFRIVCQYDPNGFGLCHLLTLDLRASHYRS